MKDLYQVLIQQTPIPCLALTQKNDACKKTVNYNQDAISLTLSEIHSDLEQGFPIQSNRVSKSLDDLAHLLICKSGHSNERNAQTRDIADVLKDRLEGYKAFQPQLTRRVGEALGLQRSHCDNLDNDSDAEENEIKAESEYEALNSTPELANPVNASKNPSPPDTSFITPTKTPRQICIPRLSFSTDDTSAGTPDSVASTQASGIFSPSSAASSAISIESDYQYKRRTRSSSRHEEASPTRGPGSRSHRKQDRKVDSQYAATFDGLDQSSNHDLNESGDNNSDKSCVIKQEHVESKFADYITFHGQAEHDSCSQKPNSGTESTPSEGLRPIKREDFAQRRRSNIEAIPRSPTRNPVGQIMKCMREIVGARSLKPGFVYWFQVGEYWKIGHTLPEMDIHDDDKDAVLIPGTKYDEAWDRIRTQKKNCQHEISAQFAMYMPCAAAKMEKLVHLTLSDRRVTIKQCSKLSCPTKHHEWFTSSNEEIASTVALWKGFSSHMPYSHTGQLRQYWENYAWKQSTQSRNLTCKEWIETSWKAHIDEAKSMTVLTNRTGGSKDGITSQLEFEERRMLREEEVEQRVKEYQRLQEENMAMLVKSMKGLLSPL